MSSSNNSSNVFDNICQQYEQKLLEAIQTYPTWRDEFLDDGKEYKREIDVKFNKNSDANKHVRLDMDAYKKGWNPYGSFSLFKCKNRNEIENHSDTLSELVRKDTALFKIDDYCYLKPTLQGYGNYEIGIRITPKFDYSALSTPAGSDAFAKGLRQSRTRY